MTDAKTLIQDIRANLLPTADAIRNHRYISAISDGRVSRKSLHDFCGNQFQMWKNNATQVSMARFASHPYRDVFLTPPEIEESAAKQVAALASDLGMDQQALEEFEPSAEAFGYAAYKAWLICFGAPSEMACARLFNLEVWSDTCTRIGQGLRTHYGLSADQTHFFDEFTGLDDLQTRSLTVIEEGLQKGHSPQSIARAARLMQDYELMFWDALAESEGL